MQSDHRCMGGGNCACTGQAWGVCFDLQEEMDEDAGDLGELEDGVGDTCLQALPQGATFGLGLPCLGDTDLPRDGPISQGNSPYDQDVAGRPGL